MPGPGLQLPPKVYTPCPRPPIRAAATTVTGSEDPRDSPRLEVTAISQLAPGVDATINVCTREPERKLWLYHSDRGERRKPLPLA